MSTTFSVTAGEVITEAFEDLGILAEGASTNTSQQARGLKAINLTLKKWAPHGLDLFVRATQSITLTADKASYTLAESGADVTMARPTSVVNAVLRDTNGEDLPVKMIAKEFYESIADKDASGPPAYLYADFSSLSYVTLYPWPIIDTSGYSLRLDYRRPLNDVTATSDTIDLQQEWYAALVAEVTARIAKKYGKQADVNLARAEFIEARGVTRQLPPNPLIGWPGEAD